MGRAALYQQKLAARRAEAPIGGDVPMPKIPILDSEHKPGLTMDQAAALQRGIHPDAAGAVAMNATQPRQSNIPQIFPTDTLNPEAKKDPRYVQGYGADLAMNQPHLAMQYGVVRNGELVPPHMLQGPQQMEGGTRFRKETLQGVKKLEEMQQAAARTSEAAEDERAKKDAEGNQTARLAGSPEEKQPISDEEAKKTLQEMDDFDYYNFTQAMMRDLINNENQRRIIEARLEPLDITDLLMNDSLTQKVPIVPGKFEPTFETISGVNDLSMKSLIAQEAKQLDVAERYLLDKFAMMQLAAGVKAINSVQMPIYKDENGVLVADKFWARFRKIAGLPIPVIASLGANYFWFDVRCRKLCTAEELKNG
jgi:hypothetical protein